MALRETLSSSLSVEPASGGSVVAAAAADADADPAGCTHGLTEVPPLSRLEAERVADLFKVLGDPTRVLILQALIHARELCVHELSTAVGMSQSAVSHHLRVLRNFDLVRQRRHGREIYYRPDDEHVEQMIGICAEHIIHRRGALDV